MPNVLEVQIIGDVSGLEKSLKQAESLQADYTKSIEKTSSELKENITISNGYKKALSDLNSEFKKGAISQKDYEKGLENIKRDEKETAVVTQDLRKQLSSLKKDQKDLGGTFDTASKKVANGGNALNQFSRIAQDAPFGIQGIGNNITATVEAFGHLQKSTGSTGAALKAVASSMLGSGGILLAVSLVTTGLTYMAQNGITVGDVFDKLTGTFDENANALKEINKEAAKTAGEEIANVKALASTASDSSLPYEKRLLAVKKLQDEFPAYFGNLTKEQILNGQVAGAVDEVSKALIARARASAIAGKLGELAAQRLDLEEKRNASILKIQEKQQKVREALNKGQSATLAPGQGVSSKADIRTKELATEAAAYRDIQKEIAELDAQTKKLAGTQAEATKASIGLLTEAPKVAKGKKSGKGIDVTPKVTALPDLETTAEVAEKYLKEFKKVFGSEFDNIAPIELNIPPVVIPAVDDSEYKASLERAKVAADIFSQGTNSAIGALGSQLASSLETGNAAVDAFTGSIIQSLADLAAAQLAGLITDQAIATAKLGTDAAVATGNAVVAGTETAAASGPAAAFVLPALVGAAIGFIAASFAGIKFAHGGIVPGGSYTGDKIPAMLNSGEAVLNSQQQANTLMAVANGNANSLQGNRQSSNFTLETKLRGSDLLLVTKREERKR